jgi:hypothetical protein
MDEEAVKAISTLAVEAAGTEVVAGRTYWKSSHELIAEPFHRPDTLKFVTLTALQSYVLGEPDRTPGSLGNNTDETPLIDAVEAFFHVEDFNRVVLLSAPLGPRNQRHRIAEAVSPVSLDFPFGQFMPVEELSIKLRTMFVRNDNVDEIVQILTKVDVTNGLQQSDDGMSQTVQVKKGISGASVEGKTTKGLYRLAPRRTFDEAEQAESEFLFRMKISEEKGATAALFQSGGNEWRLASIQNARKWLQDSIPGWKVLA